MSDLPLRLFQAVLLIIEILLGYWLWVKLRHPALPASQRNVLLLLVLTLMGGLFGGLFWWFDDRGSFAWDLPPLASRMLAAAGWAFAVASYFALERPTRRRLRLVIVMLAVYLVPLVAAILLFHLNRFDFAAPVTYGFFAIVLMMAASAVWFGLRQPAIEPDTPGETQRISLTLNIWLIVLGLVTALWGIALFVTASGPSGLIWVWPGDLLTSRLIGVMLLALAAGAFVSRGCADTARTMLAVTAVYGLGLVLASLWNTLTGGQVSFAYVVAFALVALISLAFLFRTPAPALALPAKPSSG